MSEEQSVLLLFYIFWRQLSWLVFLQNLDFITSVLSGSWDVSEDLLSSSVAPYAFFEEQSPKLEQYLNLSATEKNGRFTENVFHMTILSGSIRCLLPIGEQRLQTGWIITCCSGSWSSYDISMHAHFHISTRWGGCQFSENAWEVEWKLLLKQHESLLFKTTHPSECYNEMHLSQCANTGHPSQTSSLFLKEEIHSL